MRSIYRVIGVALALLASGFPALSQERDSLASIPSRSFDYRLAAATDTIVVLPAQFIVAGSDTIYLDGQSLVRGRDYSLDLRMGIVDLRPELLRRSFADTSAAHLLYVRYKGFPFRFNPSYQHRKPVERVDSSAGGNVLISQPSKSFSFDDLFGSNLQKSGSLTRGLTIGSNRDLTVNSGFRMQMAGNITSGLEVVAALTDENSPIQPEGTTQTLQEIDQVFVELRGEKLRATLGDFTLAMGGGEFNPLNRKLQGAKGLATYSTGLVRGETELTGAVARGKFASNQIAGQEGVQGPYLLTGENNERAIIVIAGTERVYVNGERTTRGENGDYVIDYSNAQITFTPKRVISNGSRIAVDFEYSDRQFNRSLFGGSSSASFFDDRLKLDVSFVRESDDQSSPVDVALSDSDIALLRTAGDDRTKGSRTGIAYAGPGKGQYVQFDSLVGIAPGKDTLLTLYRYAPQDTVNALYSGTFTFVGAGNGNYSKVAVGNYQFAGWRLGSYEPVRFLPMPQSHSLADVGVGGNVTDDLKLSGEFALSSFDPNTFSSIGDDAHSGGAANLGIHYAPKSIRLGSADLGSLEADFKERYVNARFAPMDRVNDVEFDRKWNVADSIRGDEELREGSLQYRPLQTLSLGAGLGSITRGTPFSSHRATLSGHLTETDLPSVDYDLEDISSRNSATDVSGAWLRQKGGLEKKFGSFIPGIRFASELLQNRSLSIDSLEGGSYRFNEIAPRIVVGREANLGFSAETGWRREDSAAAGNLGEAAWTFIQHYTGQLRQWKSLSSTIDLTLQNRKYTSVFKERNNQDARTLLLRWQTRANPLDGGVESDWFYEVATQRSSKLDRVFQRVATGTGNYVYAGDLNDNHVVDAPDFQLSRFDGDFIAVTVPTDELVPVTNLKTSARIRLTPSRFGTEGWLMTGLRHITTETYARVDETSSDPDVDRIAFLHFSHFLNDVTTLAGSNLITQDLYWGENDPALSIRLRFSQRRGLTQYALAAERTYMREQSVRLRWQLVKEFSNQVDYTVKRDALTANEPGSRVRDIPSQALASDWSYRPEQRIEVGFTIGVGRATNFDTTEADLNSQAVRCVYSFEEHGQARVDFTREEVLLTRAGTFLPFELTNGEFAGKSWLWHVGLEYRLTRFIQASLGYDGRTEGGRPPVHTARAEVRALF